MRNGCENRDRAGNRLGLCAFQLRGEQRTSPITINIHSIKLTMENSMSGTGEKIKGYANEAVGNLKQGVGKLVGSEKLQAKGAAQELKGEAQQAVGSAKKTASDIHDNVTSSSTADKAAGHYNDAMGTAKQKAGRAVGSAELEADGLAQEVKGEAQKISGDVKKSVGR
jgi:uncharacterized protein YjbJ (UPF0337 family)